MGQAGRALDGPRGVHQQVAGLEVAVQAAVRVQVRHAARGAQAQVRHLRPAQVHGRAVQHRVQAAPARPPAPHGSAILALCYRPPECL